MLHVEGEGVIVQQAIDKVKDYLASQTNGATPPPGVLCKAEDCGREFKNQAGLQCHMSKKHRKGFAPMKNKRERPPSVAAPAAPPLPTGAAKETIRCAPCGLTFATKEALDNHVLKPPHRAAAR